MGESQGLPAGLIHRRFWTEAEQRGALAAVAAAARAAPLYAPTMPRTGKPFSVRMTNCGPLGWVSDRDGYRYQATHPATGKSWPPIPGHRDGGLARGVRLSPPARGLPRQLLCARRQDGPAPGYRRAGFRCAGGVALARRRPACSGSAARRGRPERSFRLSSGDVVVLGGESRLAFHGIDRIYPGTSTLLRDWFPEGGRINLTLRRVTKPA